MTMRIRFIRGTALGGIGNDAAPGEERDLPEAQAAQLINLKRAVAVPEIPVQEEPAAKPVRKKGK